MSDGDAIMAAVLAEPAVDLHRLAYADWLDEQGDAARAEFIRAQVEAAFCAVTLVGIGNPAVIKASRRAQKLLERWCPDWIAPFDPDWISGVSSIRDRPDSLAVHLGDGHGLRFHRGFVAEIRCELAWWLEDGRGAACVAACPIERVVTEKKPLPLSTPDAPPTDPWHGWYCWGDASLVLPGSTPEESAAAEYNLPREILKALEGRRLEGNPYDVYFPSEKAALDAISAALLGAVRPRSPSGSSPATTPRPPAYTGSARSRS
jgi:uncharacterized protein (TIGR02996 family)